MQRVSLSKAKSYKRRKVYYRNRQGNLLQVVSITKKSPNWRLTLANSFEFLVDPSTLLELEDLRIAPERGGRG